MTHEIMLKDGAEHVVVPKQEYDHLLERLQDLSDITAAREVATALASREEETLPSEFVTRMLAGTSLVKLWREHRGMTQNALATAASVNRVQISEIEAGKKNGSVETLKKLANALNVRIDDLI